MNLEITSEGEIKIGSHGSAETYLLTLLFKKGVSWELDVSTVEPYGNFILKQVDKAQKSIPELCDCDKAESTAVKEPKTINFIDDPVSEKLPDSDPSREEIIDSLKDLGFTAAKGVKTKTLLKQLKKVQAQKESSYPETESSETEYLKKFIKPDVEADDSEDDQPKNISLEVVVASLHKYIKVFSFESAQTLIKSHGAMKVSELSQEARNKVWAKMDEKINESTSNDGDPVPF